MLGQYLGQLTGELADLAHDFGPRAVGRLGQSAHEGAADNQSIGHRRELANLVGAADSKADADRQLGLGAQPGDGFGELAGQALALASDPGDRDIVNEARGRPRDLDGTVPRRRGRDQLDQLELAAVAAFSARAGDSSTGKSGTISPSSPAVTASAKNRSIPCR